MIHGLGISVMRDKIYKVLDIAKISYNIDCGGNDRIVVKRKKVMKNIKSIKETRLSVMVLMYV